MPLNISLKIGTERYDVLQCQYGFGRVVTPLGWPGRGVNGGDIILVMESTKSNTLFEEFTRKRVTPISGSIEIYEVDEKIVVRTIAFEEAFLYSIGENMQKDSSLPMTMTIAISPLRLDFDHKIRLDRRWPQTQGFWWEEHKREEEPIVVSKEDDPTYIIKDAYWIDEEGNQIRDLSVDVPVTLYVVLADYTAGNTINLTFENEDADDVKTVKYSGIVDDTGIVTIDNFKFESSNKEGRENG
jgi:hypothetical protein